MEQESLLANLDYNPVLAGKGKRFLNYLIDIIFFYIVCFALGFLFANEIYNMRINYTQSQLQLTLQLIAVVLLLLYYCLLETILKGRTIGKFITGTKAVNEDGSLITPKTALLRSLSRLVPFEPFSAFGGRPWHDKWTKTFVIDIRKTDLQNQL